MLTPVTSCTIGRARYVCLTCRAQSTAQKALRRAYSTTPTRRPLQLAIIGSGPAGFYSAYRLLKKLPDTRITMFEQLPVPYGLARYGVAPDHPEVKVHPHLCLPISSWKTDTCDLTVEMHRNARDSSQRITDELYLLR